MKRRRSQLALLTLCLSLLLPTRFAGAKTAVSNAAIAASRRDVSVHYATVTVGDIDEERAEIAHLRALVTPRRPFVNDLADDRQLRFTLRNLKKAGKTPKNAPQLFTTIANQRALHKTKPPSQEAFAALPAGVDQRIPLNAIVTLGPVAQTATTYSTTGVSSIPGGTISTIAVTQLFDASTNTPFGPAGSTQQFGGGENVTATETSPAAQTLPDVGSYLQVTYQANTSSDPVTLTVMTSAASAPIAPPTVTAPAHVFTNPPNPNIKVCLSRNTVPDPNCDYGPFQAPSANPLVQLPVTGNITFGAAVDTSRTITGTLVVWGQKGGGACTLNLPATDFAQAFTPSGSQLNWTFFNLVTGTRVNTAAFGMLNGNPCWQPDQPFGMTLDVSVPIVGELLPEEFFVTTIAGPSLGNATRISPLTFTWGCFAAGSRVLMADGSVMAIDDVKVGDVVIADRTGRRLTVREKTEGYEFEPMVIITDAAGHTLSVTEKHAVVVRDEARTRVVLAKDLKVGDVVFGSDLALENGKPRNFAPSRVERIERKKDDRHVYNVYLGIRERGEQFDTSDTTLIADGILTGDNRMQEFYGADFNFKPKNVRDRLPREWRRDYENYLNEQNQRASVAGK